MNYLIKNARIFDKNSPLHLKKMDLSIRRGKIEKIARTIDPDEKTQIIKGKNLCVSVGWMDIGTRLSEPGFEDVDDIKSLCSSAAAGGFTSLAVFPNTFPVIDNKGAVEAIQFRSAAELVDLLPIGALTVGIKGQEITEMNDMTTAGAVAFSDGLHSIQHAGVIQRALRYITNLSSLIINHPVDKSLSESGIMNESGESAFLGLKGIPSLSEELMLNRDIQLCEYTESRLLSHLISTRESVRLIKKAKQNNDQIYASVSFHNLVESDKVLRDFDPMHKVLPPLRTKKDNNALLKGLLDDSVDCIVSNHVPADVEEKKKAFFYAGFGSLGLEQMFGVLRSRLGNKLPLEVLIDKLTRGPRKVLNLPDPVLAEENEANITIFDPDEEWVFNKKAIKSKSENAAFLDMNLKGKVVGVFANNKSTFN